MADPPPTLARADSGGYAMYTGPYGVDRGTCERGRLAYDLASDQRRQAKPKPGDGDKSQLVNAMVGRSMDATDQACVSRILEYTPDRAAVRWYGAATAAYGGPVFAVTPLRTFERDGQFCRDYLAVGTVDGQTEQTYGTACRMPDGIWNIAG